ncbi:hypothetical protein RE432_14925 [Pusillimonas sp. SM2304]|uniref:hypothetical protein n=1 Tax=Pusillimonas sp. SM2304 TaxID=3073241 RepID=UPI00287418D0|nr:hypothetical protein [Pusillimonas sp. SM2304]MDS1141732.1 hypothetical protein [Pusillimonas sp. SM2304]
MTKSLESPAREAMRHARRLAKIKSRHDMLPIVRFWAAAMKRGIAVAYFNGPRWSK